MALSVRKIRPISFSEGHIHIPELSRPELYEALPAAPHTDQPPHVESYHIYDYTFSFTFHLTLISLFETIFFWNFVAPTEDAALIGLVNGYTNGLCKGISTYDTIIAKSIFNILANQTTAIRTSGAAAFGARSSFNDRLTLTSWIYVSGLIGIVIVLAGVGWIRGYKVNWLRLVCENLALVCFLGLYEWMFFSTIILHYQTISMAELNVMILNAVISKC
jgi:hypothetical protein